VAGLTLAQYLELREVRIALEGMAAEAAAVRVTDAAIEALAGAHDALIRAEEAGDWLAANRANWAFHHGVFRAAERPELLAILEGIWLRNGPMLAHLYPDARPTYRGRHRHLDVIEGLRRRDPRLTRDALAADMVEGGARLVEHLARLEAAAGNSKEEGP
jgi:DNA-binding GntR family transcriptional regulator